MPFILAIFTLLIGCQPVAPHINNVTATLSTATESFRGVVLVNVHDGDTFTANLPHPIPNVFGHEIPVRIRHIDTAELKGVGKCERAMAETAKAALTSLLNSAKRIDLEDVGRDSFFRILASVKVDGVDVADYMLTKHLAYKYEGETKPKINWCLLKEKRN